jgi:hypothetical protein
MILQNIRGTKLKPRKEILNLGCERLCWHFCAVYETVQLTLVYELGVKVCDSRV